MRPNFCRLLAPVGLLALALGCSEDSETPTSPASPIAGAAAATALTFRQITNGALHSCGVTTDNVAYCWGWGTFGQLGNDSLAVADDGTYDRDIYVRRPSPVAGGLRFREVVASWEYSCGVTTDSRAYCWGSNLFNQLGDGTDRRYVARPVAVVGGLRFLEVRPGGGFVCGVTTDHQIYCWGFNELGELGDGTRMSRTSPVLVAGNHKWRTVTSGAYYACGITTGYVTYCWGYNKQGQLGDSSSARSKVKPSRVAGGHTFTQVDAGYDHSCAVTQTGEAYCWGNGAQGTLGNGKTYLSFWPRLVAGGHVFKQVSAGIFDGGSHSCGRTTSNQIYCWGFNNTGQLGDGTQTRRLRPVAVKGGIPMVQIWAGYENTCGVTAAGAGYCWGAGQFGEIGDGSADIQPRLVPVRVLGPE